MTSCLITPATTEVVLGDLLAPAYRDHYRKMATFAKAQPGSRVKIEEVPATLPTSFVVVKDRNSNGGQIIWPAMADLVTTDVTYDRPGYRPSTAWPTSWRSTSTRA